MIPPDRSRRIAGPRAGGEAAARAASRLVLFGAADLALGLFLHPDVPAARLLAFWMVAGGLLALAAWAAAALPLAARIGWPAADFGVTVGLLAALAAAHLALDAAPAGLGLRGGALVAALAVVAGAAAALAARRGGGAGAKAADLLGLAPLPLAVAAAALWLHRRGGGGWFSLRTLALAAAAVALAAVLVGLLRRRPVTLRGVLPGAVLLALVVVSVMPTDGGEAPRPPAPSAAAGRPPIVLVTLDTVRADELGCRGGGAVPLGGFCRDAVEVAGAAAPAPWTLPSLTSYLTGLPVSVHGVTRPLDTLPPELPSLAERLSAAGYATAVFANSPFVDGGGLGRGFGRRALYPRGGRAASLVPRLFAALGVEPPAGLALEATTDRLVDLALRWLGERGDGPWFLWLHDFEPHRPYAPPRRLLSGRPAGSVGWSFDRFAAARSGLFVPTPAERAWIAALHRAEVAAAAGRLERLFEGLRRLGAYERAWIVVVADHGEELWEHGGYEHGHALWREVVEVPLLVKPPGGNGAGGRTVEARVSALRLHATLRRAAGLDPVAGLAPLPLGEDDPAGGAFEISGCLYFGDCLALVEGDAKLVRHRGRELLFDLAADPAERWPETGARLAAIAAAADRRAEAAAAARRALGLGEASTEAGAADAETRRRLRALGYLP